MSNPTSNLQQLFNRVVMEAQPTAVKLPGRAAYNSLRVALVRKFTNYVQRMNELGVEAFVGQYLSCTFDKSTNIGSFALRDKEESKRSSVSYEVIDL